MGDSLLKTKNLCTSYRKVPILKNVNVSLQEREVTGLIGRNGAGKSTLFKTIIGLHKPDSGKIFFEGKNITGLAPYKGDKARIGYVHEDRRIYGEMTVEENLKVPLEEKEKWKEKKEKVMDLFPDLRGREKAKGKELSGGMQQMLAIGRTLIKDTRVLLLDEPVEGLSPDPRDRIIKGLKDMKHKITLFIIEHDIQTIKELADKCYIMINGEIVEELKDPEDAKVEF